MKMFKTTKRSSWRNPQAKYWNALQNKSHNPLQNADTSDLLILSIQWKKNFKMQIKQNNIHKNKQPRWHLNAAKKPKASIATQTDLTWPQGADTPVPAKTNSQTMQTDSNENSANKHRNTTSPSPPPRSNRGANAPIPSTSKGGQGDPHPRLSTSTSPKKNAKPWINRPPPHTDDPIAMFSRYGVLDVEGGGDSDAE